MTVNLGLVALHSRRINIYLIKDFWLVKIQQSEGTKATHPKVKIIIQPLKLALVTFPGLAGARSPASIPSSPATSSWRLPWTTNDSIEANIKSTTTNVHSGGWRLPKNTTTTQYWGCLGFRRTSQQQQQPQQTHRPSSRKPRTPIRSHHQSSSRRLPEDEDYQIPRILKNLHLAPPFTKVQSSSLQQVQLYRGQLYWEVWRLNKNSLHLAPPSAVKGLLTQTPPEASWGQPPYNFIQSTTQTWSWIHQRVQQWQDPLRWAEVRLQQHRRAEVRLQQQHLQHQQFKKQQPATRQNFPRTRWANSLFEKLVN